MMRYFFSLVFLLLPVQFCVNQELPNYSLTDVPLTVDIDSVKYIPLNISYIRYIPLETTPDCIIGHMSKMLFKDGKIYIADFHKTMTLFVFDTDGKFLFKVFRMGKGPGEYISFHDFDVQTNGDIYMFDPFGKKFLVFDPAGKYLKELRVDYSFSYFTLVKDKMYWSRLSEYGKMYANLAAYHVPDKKTEFLLNNKRNLYDNKLLNFTSYEFYSSPNGAVYYSPKFSEIIYSIDSAGVHPAIGIKNLHIPPDQTIEEWSRLRPDLGIGSDKLYFKQNIYVYETDRYITFQCIIGMLIQSSVFLYDKNSHSICYSPVLRYFTDIGINEIKGSTGKYFFSYIDPNSDNEYHRKILETREELAGWKEEDNPVVVIFDIEI